MWLKILGVKKITKSMLLPTQYKRAEMKRLINKCRTNKRANKLGRL